MRGPVLFLALCVLFLYLFTSCGKGKETQYRIDTPDQRWYVDDFEEVSDHIIRFNLEDGSEITVVGSFVITKNVTE
jgi:hypothetical protein